MRVITSPSAAIGCRLTSETQEGEEVLRFGLALGQILNGRGQGRGGDQGQG